MLGAGRERGMGTRLQVGMSLCQMPAEGRLVCSALLCVSLALLPLRLHCAHAGACLKLPARPAALRALCAGGAGAAAQRAAGGGRGAGQPLLDQVAIPAGGDGGGGQRRHMQGALGGLRLRLDWSWAWACVEGQREGLLCHCPDF